MAWVWVFLAGIAEIGWMVALKLSDGFSRYGWIAAGALISLFSVGLMALAVRTLPMGTAYTVWTGMGAAGIAIIGILFFGEPRSVMRIAFIACVIVGIVGLKLTSND